MSRREALWKGLVLAAAGLAVTACAATSWNKAGVTDAQLNKDLTACQAAASSAVETRYGRQLPRHRDEFGDNPYSSQTLSSDRSFNTMMVRNEAIRASDRMVVDCMKAKGYTWGRVTPDK